MLSKQYYQEAVALGSKTGLSIVSSASSIKIETLYHDLWHTIFLFERQFSRFLPDSELSLFNRKAGIKQIISPAFHDFLVAASKISRDTAGLYNPFVLPAVQAAGYSHSRVPGYEQDAVDDHSNKSVVTIDRLEVGNNWARIPYGTAIDLGGCGKGYLADQLRDKLPSLVTGYWFSFGGDIVVGGNDERNRPWTVSIQSAGSLVKSIGTIMATTACGIATSGTTVHHGKKGNLTWHHLIDPRTRQPAKTDVLLATVCHSSALRADVLASCAVILGRKKGLAFLRKQGAESVALQCNKEGQEPWISHFGTGIIMGSAYA